MKDSHNTLAKLGYSRDGKRGTLQVNCGLLHRFRSQGSYIKVTEASLTYVAIDEAGQPREVPKPAKA